MTFQREKKMKREKEGCDKVLPIHTGVSPLLLVDPVCAHSTMTFNLPVNQLKISSKCLKVPMS